MSPKKKLLAKAAKAFVRGETWLTSVVRVQGGLQLFQQNETIPYKGIEFIRKAINAEQSNAWSTLEEYGCLTAWAVNKR